jgi:hypothetical protein
MVNYARDHSVADGLNYIATWNAAMLMSDDLTEAMTARANHPCSRPLKKCATNASGSFISKKPVDLMCPYSDQGDHVGLFSGRLARFGRTYPRTHA